MRLEQLIGERINKIKRGHSIISKNFYNFVLKYEDCDIIIYKKKII